MAFSYLEELILKLLKSEYPTEKQKIILEKIFIKEYWSNLNEWETNFVKSVEHIIKQKEKLYGESEKTIF